MANNLHPADAYFHALGMFIQKFGQTEALLLSALKRLIGLDGDTARVVFAGTRVAVAKDQINATRDARGLSRNPILERAFAHLTDITTMRNDILHYGATFQENYTAVVTNISQAKPGKERVNTVTPKLLGQMSADLGTISLAISAVLFEAPNDEARIAWEQGGQRPWLYKP